MFISNEVLYKKTFKFVDITTNFMFFIFFSYLLCVNIIKNENILLNISTFFGIVSLLMLILTLLAMSIRNSIKVEFNNYLDYSYLNKYLFLSIIFIFKIIISIMILGIIITDLFFSNILVIYLTHIFIYKTLKS